MESKIGVLLSSTSKSYGIDSVNPTVVAARAATAGSEHGAVGGAVGLGSVRHSPEKEGT